MYRRKTSHHCCCQNWIFVYMIKPKNARLSFQCHACKGMSSFHFGCNTFWYCYIQETWDNYTRGSLWSKMTLLGKFVWCICIMWSLYCVSHFVNLYFFLKFLMQWLSTFILPGPKFYEYWYGSNNERKVLSHTNVVSGQQVLKLCFLNEVQIWGLPFVPFTAYIQS